MNCNSNINKSFLSKFSVIVLVLVMFTTLFSCVTNKQAIYLQPGKDKKVDFVTIEKKTRTIIVGDELNIQVTTEDQATTINTANRSSAFGMTNDNTLLTYFVNDEGYVRFPIIGNIKMEGLTLEEAASAIEQALIGILTAPSATVRFVNKSVTVLGEVNVPGRYIFPDKHINILQALAYAGDISYFGNRKKVMLLREENNIISRNYIDLTDESILTSYYYYIKPNDVIYVEPLKRKKWGMQTFPVALIFSIISSTIIIFSYLRIYN